MLGKVIEKSFSKLAPTQWNYLSCLVKTVNESKEDIMGLLENIFKKLKNFDEKIKNSARKFLAGINIFYFNF